MRERLNAITEGKKKAGLGEIKYSEGKRIDRQDHARL